MNQILREEELDRELVLNPVDPSIYRAVKANVSPKNLSFTSYHHELQESSGKYIHKTRITFKKECTSKNDSIEVFVEKFQKNTRQVRCNLGHYHGATEEYEFAEWQRLVLSWEDFEQLVEWFQNGRFYDPRTRQAKKAGSKDGFHSQERIK